MPTSKEILEQVKKIFSTKWEEREGQKVPEPEELKLSNDAVKMKGTVLYADMTDSTGLVVGYKDWFASEVYKAYLNAACHIIRNNSGTITAFDGDRVMAVFIGKTKNSDAAKTGLQINYICQEINKALKEKYPNSAYQLSQVVGIDTSDLFISRTGIRKSNDLVWVGRAANYAAKISDLSSSGQITYITSSVFEQLSDETKYGGSPRKCMWEKQTWTETGMIVYSSTWSWSF